MCGFFGLIDRSEADLDLAQLETRITRRLRQRGPDVCKATRTRGMYLAHSRLSITGEGPEADQPLVSQDGSVYLLFNGEIYNYNELRQRYFHDEIFRTTSDTEVILKVYERYGCQGLNLLDGTYALAIVDVRAGLVHLVRDAVGKKPLFYATQRSLLVFSSDASLIRAYLHADISREAVQYYIVNYFPPPTQSMYVGIHAVLPGHLLTFSSKGHGDTISPGRVCPVAEYEQNGDLTDDVLRALRRAVEKRITCVKHPLLYLSGGLDSTLVAKLLREHFDRVEALTIKPVVPWDLDYPYAERVAKRYGLSLRTIRYPVRHLSDRLDELISRQDEPIGGLSYVPLALMTLEARRLSKIVFTGDGGDEVFYGYGSIALWTDRSAPSNLEQVQSGPPLPQWVSSAGRQQANEFLVAHGFARLDRAVSEFGVEARCPLCDYALMALLRRQPRERVLARSKQVEKEILREDFSETFLERRKLGFPTRIKYYHALDGFAFTRRQLTPHFEQYLVESIGLPQVAVRFPPSRRAIFRDFPGYWNLAVLSAFLRREGVL